MKVTIKGQVTIPRIIREKLCISPATEVDFIEEKGRVYWHRFNPGLHLSIQCHLPVNFHLSYHQAMDEQDLVNEGKLAEQFVGQHLLPLL